MPRPPFLLLTCEHGGNRIPPAYRNAFKNAPLKSHRGWDLGALAVAKLMQRELNTPLLFSETSRLLVDLNRSLGRPGHFSDFTPASGRQTIIDKFYTPYREKASDLIASKIKSGYCVYHFSIHSFTPRLNGIVRNCDLGLLYDPRRPLEARLSRSLKTHLRALDPNLRVRLNYPYKGIADGFPPTLRKMHNPHLYSGIEIEFNQGWIANSSPRAFVRQFSQLLRERIEAGP